MFDISLSANITYQLLHVGHERTPILIIDDLVENPVKLIASATQLADKNQPFHRQKSDYYPGIRKKAPQNYQGFLCQHLFQLLQSSSFLAGYGEQEFIGLDVIMSAFSIATTKPEALRPIQMLPHFDTLAAKQLAMVHYLCHESHGGTSIYRHKETGFERLTEQRHAQYRHILKRQAISENLHLNPKYIEGDTVLFERIFSVEAKMNRAIIYPSNVLHSGNIRPKLGLCSSPESGRLTLSSFLCLK